MVCWSWNSSSNRKSTIVMSLAEQLVFAKAAVRLRVGPAAPQRGALLFISVRLFRLNDSICLLMPSWFFLPPPSRLEDKVPSFTKRKCRSEENESSREVPASRPERGWRYSQTQKGRRRTKDWTLTSGRNQSSPCWSRLTHPPKGEKNDVWFAGRDFGENRSEVISDHWRTSDQHLEMSWRGPSRVAVPQAFQKSDSIKHSGVCYGVSSRP